MILYHQDIMYDNAYIHKETKNKSFIKMYLILKKMNVTNNKFMLTLLNKELIGVDPWDENLSTEMKMKILTEVKYNPWYYFREVLRVQHSGKRSYFKADRLSISIIWLFLQSLNQAIIAPRQHGKTFTVLMCQAWAIYFGGYNYKVAMMTKDNSLRKDNLSILSSIKDEGVPEWMIHESNNDKDNQMELHYGILNNGCSGFVAQSSQFDAQAQGRGLTVAAQHWDESAFYKFNYITIPAALPAMNAAVDQAIEAGQIHGLIMTTTPGLLSVKEGEYIYKHFINRSVPFNEVMYDFANTAKLKEVVDKNSAINMVWVEYNPLQLGKSKEWIRNKIRMIKTKDSNTEEIRRDYFNIWLYAGSTSTLDSKTINKLKDSSIEPLYVQEIDSYLIYWYLSEKDINSSTFNNIPLVAGTDGSENVGKDFTTMVILDARSMQVVGRIRCNESNTTKMAIFFSSLMLKYKNMLFIPERNSTGLSIIDTMLIEFENNNINPFRRIYNTVVEEGSEEDVRQHTKSTNYDSLLVDRSRKHFGFRSNQKTRNLLYKNTFTRSMKYNFDKIYDNAIINELIKLRVKNGRIDHLSAEHDDLVIAYLLACYWLYFSSKLHKYYNYSKLVAEPLSSYTEQDSNDDEENLYGDMYEDIINEILDTEDKLKASKSDMEKMQLYHRINWLKNSIPPDALSTKRISNTMKDISETKTRNLSTNKELKDQLKTTRKLDLSKYKSLMKF